MYRKLFIVVLLLLAANVVVLDIREYRNYKNEKSLVKQSEQPERENDFSCPLSCITKIQESTSSSTLVTPSPTKQTATPGSTASTAKEFYLPLGSGTNATDDWADVVGAKIYANSVSYERIKNVVFEASVRVSNANQDVYVRLYNDTDKHPVWFSDLFFPSGTTSNFLVSQSITLDPGEKLYKVQMKTQLKATAVLDQARIHITTY